jgi:hypothetical protein
MVALPRIEWNSRWLRSQASIVRSEVKVIKDLTCLLLVQIIRNPKTLIKGGSILHEKHPVNPGRGKAKRGRE